MPSKVVANLAVDPALVALESGCSANREGDCGGWREVTARDTLAILDSEDSPAVANVHIPQEFIYRPADIPGTRPIPVQSIAN